MIESRRTTEPSDRDHTVPRSIRDRTLFRTILPWMLLALASISSAQDNETCLECHLEENHPVERADGKIPPFIDLSIIENSSHRLWDCIDCHEGFDPETIPHLEQRPPLRVDCLPCHEDFDPSTHAFHPRLADPSVPRGDPAVDCAGCHGGHGIAEVADDAFPFSAANNVTSCGTCHSEVKTHFEASAHFLAEGETPDCLSCHRIDIVDGDQPALELKIAQSKLCMSCHVDRPEAAMWTHLQKDFVASWGASVHGRALESGKADAANCVDCHGSHDMKRAMVADSRVNKLHITETCQKCHEAEAESYESGIHAEALRSGVLESPVCTDCHGEHLILEHLDPRSLVAPRNVSQELCGECHGSVRLARKYGISSNRFETFSDSYHGLAVRSGAVEVVNCASCHGYHAIWPSIDPRSPIHKSNLAKTCGECHPRANELFGVGSVHVSLAPSKLGRAEDDSIIQIVATVYVWLIVLVVGSMFLHNLLDFLKQTRRKVHGQRHAPIETTTPHRLYLRMSVHERLQHGVLVISFVVLVVTGFMLSFPDAWWVVPLRAMSDHLFEMRGWLHRIAGVILLAAGVWHVGYLALTQRGHELFRALLPQPSDLSDMIRVLRFNLGLAKHKPRFGRFSYMEKVEYWALMWGSILMGLTGIMLWGESITMGLVTKLGFDVARTIHFYEAILATLAIIVWHFYFVIFNPEVYPMNLSWLTGYLSEEEMEAEHPAELERLKSMEMQVEMTPPPDA